MKETRTNAYNKFNFETVREKVYMFVKQNPGQTSDQICNGLGISIRNAGRLTELEKADYVYTKIDYDKNKSMYFAKDENKTYSHLDFKDLNKKGVSMDKKLADEIGFYLVSIQNLKLDNEDKKMLINDFLKLYSAFIFSNKKPKHLIDDIKVLHNKMSIILECNEVKIE